jgi:hypothetical protein
MLSHDFEHAVAGGGFYFRPHDCERASSMNDA